MSGAFKMGDAVATRDGRPARIICDDAPDRLSLVSLIGEDGALARHYKDGTGGHYVETARSAPDLVRRPRQRDLWIVPLEGFFEGKLGCVAVYEGEPLMGSVNAQRVTVTEVQSPSATEE